MGKALMGLLVVFGAIAIMLSVVGQPTYQGGDGTTVSYGGLTIFDTWNERQAQETARVRIQEAQETERKRVAEEAMTQRNKDFWGQAPWVLLSIAGIAGVVGGAFVGVAWAQRKPASRVTVNMLAAPTDLHQFAAMLGIDNAQFEYTGEWRVVDPVTADRYQPPPQLARLPGPRRQTTGGR
jgi:hypothetical protein